MTINFTRRLMLASSTSTLLLAGCAKSKISNGVVKNASGTAFEQAVQNPPVSVRPKFRWWWPGGAVNIENIEKEAREMARAGFGGFEIADVRDSVQVPIDPKKLGWASDQWKQAVNVALKTAAEENISSSLTLGPHWPTGIPTIKPDDAAAAKEIVHGVKQVSAGEIYRAAIPAPNEEHPTGFIKGRHEDFTSTPFIISVQAYKVLHKMENGPTHLDASSRLDLMEFVDDGQLNWTAPIATTQGEKWNIISFWMRGTAQIQNMFHMNNNTSMLADPIPYVLDIYGKAAVESLTDYWDQNMLSAKTLAYLKQTDGTFFEDSLELSASCPWTPKFRREFKARKGYDLTPYLALLVSREPTFEEMISGHGRPAIFTLEGIDIDRVRHDFESVLSEMYVENRLEGLNEWARKKGLKFRVQAIGSGINSGLAAAHAEIPEGDNSNDIHGWRQLAAGRDINGKTILSNECGTFVKGMAHAASWRDLLYMIQRDMAGGANQMMLHGFPHSDAPDAVWPGFSAFGRVIGNDWGPRDPMWTSANDVSDYLGRLQYFLQRGKTKSDLAIIGDPVRSQSLLHAGYTFQYPVMELFDRPQMIVKKNRLMIEGPAYRAIVLHDLQNVDLGFARKIEGFANQGFPIVMIGTLPNKARGLANAVMQDQAIQKIFKTIRTLSNVKQVQQQKDLAKALQSLNVISGIEFSQKDRVLALQRETDSETIYYFLNDAPTSSVQTVSLKNTGKNIGKNTGKNIGKNTGYPYQVDLWSGEIQALPQTIAGQKIEFRMALAADEPAIIIVSKKPIKSATPFSKLTGSDTRKILALENWAMKIEKWMPSLDGKSTIKEQSSVSIPSLIPWTSIKGLHGAAGVATYSTLVNLSKSSLHDDIVLSLGDMKGSAKISINGSVSKTINPFTNSVKIGQHLRVGDNKIEITIASTLNNLLIENKIENMSFGPPQNDQAEKPELPKMKEKPKNIDPDMMDGPQSESAMQPGSNPPGIPRELIDYGLVGPVVLSLPHLG